MPFKAGKSPSDAIRNVKKVLDEVVNVRQARATKAILYAIGARADQYVPIDTNALLSSRQQNIKQSGAEIIGNIGYYQNYAFYLHSPRPGSVIDNWKPRKPGASGKKTGGYNPSARQNWLNIGFEEIWPDTIMNIYKREMAR